MFQKLEEIIVEVYKILHDKEMGGTWTAWSLFQNKHYEASNKVKLKVNIGTSTSMQQGSIFALWVQKLNSILRRNCARLWDTDPQKVPRWANNITWGKAAELDIAVTSRISE